MVVLGLSDIQSEVIRATLCETIEKQIKSKNYKIAVSSASKAGENNFIGIIYRVVFNKEDEIENGESPASKLILKSAPSNLTYREKFFVRPAFVREIYTYEKILPNLRQFEESRGVIVEKDGFHEYPKCYRSFDEEPIESLILEDLSVRGFTIVNRATEELSADHIRVLMKTLGKFHAISLALKDQQPEKFKELTSSLTEIFVRPGAEHLRTYYNNQAERVFNLVSDDADLLAKVKKFYERDAVKVLAECLDLEATGLASVITHGDMWQNNMMFTYNNNGTPIDVSLLDWQITRHASPIIDIVYFMFLCTTKELRDAHYEDFLKLYHSSLSAHVRRLGSDPEILFPYSLMLEHLHKFAKSGLVISVGFNAMISDIFEDSRHKFNAQTRGVISDMVRLGYI